MPSTQNGRLLEEKDEFSSIDSEKDGCKAMAEERYEKSGTEKAYA